MLEVKSFLNFSGGSMGETTFMRLNGKNTARNKIVVSPDRFKSHPRFARVRENAGDFGRASKSGRAIRNAVSTICKWNGDGNAQRLLQKLIRKIIKSDGISQAGDGNVKYGDINLLMGYNFNSKTRLRAKLNLNYTTEFSLETSMLIINIPSFKPENSMKVPDGTTHYQLVTAGMSINFRSGTFETKSEITSTPLLPFDNNDTSALTAVHNVEVNQDNSYLLVMGIQYYKVAGKWIDSVKNHAADCLAIVGALN